MQKNQTCIGTINEHPSIFIDLKTKPICCLIIYKQLEQVLLHAHWQHGRCQILATMTDKHMTDVCVTVCVRFVYQRLQTMIKKY